MEAGFTVLLDSLEDLQTDVPEAIVRFFVCVFVVLLSFICISSTTVNYISLALCSPIFLNEKTMVSSFLARAVVDEVLPPAFLSDQNNNRPGDPVIEKAVSLLSREHCNARLEKVWGPGDGRPVAELKTEMDQLLQEYLLSRELDEAARCVKALEAPHFHHELVKRGVKIAMELDGSHANGGSTNGGGTNGSIQHHELSNMDAMAALFGFLVRNVIISEYQVKKGIARLHTLLPDLSLDVPAAPKLLKEFEVMAAQGGCLGKLTTMAAPTGEVEE